MSITRELSKRSNDQCEMCSSEEPLDAYTVPPKIEQSLAHTVNICATCSSQINDSSTADANHWRCLYESMWSELLPIQVLSYRMLSRLSELDWTADLLEQMYLDEDSLAWAKATEPDEEATIHLDSNGVVLAAGDTVVLIKDLKVKGGGFTAKRGTAVRRISLVTDQPTQIEGRVEGQQVVLLTEYVKKSKA